MKTSTLASLLLVLSFLPSSIAAAEPTAVPDPRWVACDGPIGGLGYDIRYNFGNPLVWYVTDSYAGLNMSTDDGLTWVRVEDGITTRRGGGDTIPVFSATVDPNDPNIAWIGTQESGDIFKSTDGGLTWTLKINGTERTNANWLSFRGFTIEPGNSNVVYAMAEIASPGFTADGSPSKCFGPDKAMGVVYKTVDGGENWTKIWQGNALARYCFIDPRNHDVIYVSTGIFDREAADCSLDPLNPGGVGVLKSTDGGATWCVFDRTSGLTDLHVGSLFLNPAYPDVLLAAASNPDWSGKLGPHTGGVFLSEDGGEHWSKVLSSEESNENYATVEFCPSDPNIAYAASPLAVYRSSDRGLTWQRFQRSDETWGPNGVIAGFPIDMQCDPVDVNRVFVNNYLGGNFLSTNGGKTWSIASRGYTGAQMGFLEVSKSNSKVVFAGSRTGAFRSDSAGMGDWVGLSSVFTSDGLRITLNELNGLAVDPSDKRHLIASPLDLNGLVASRDGGRSWTVSFTSEATDVMVGAPAFSPVSSQRAYVGVTAESCGKEISICEGEHLGLWFSDDGGTNWSPVSAPEILNHSIGPIVPHPTALASVYVSVTENGVWRSTDGGQSWSNRSNGLPAAAHIAALTVDPSLPDTLFAGLRTGGIYRTTDGGGQWSQVTTGMDPESSITSIVVDPTAGYLVYAAEKDAGVYRSTNGGESWSLFNEGLNNRAVRALAISQDGARLYAATNGAGVSRIDLEPVPLVLSLTPKSGTHLGGAEVTITGTNFLEGCTVTIAGIPVPVTFNSATSLTVVTPPLPAGTLSDVVVTNPGAWGDTLEKGWLADFLDVPRSHGFHNFVEAIVRAGITGGCGGGAYCPSNSTTRAQMAVFLLLAKYGAGFAPSPATGTVFADVNAGSFAASWIERLAAEGITGGCSANPPLYCPNSAVTRSSMAVFLIKAHDGTVTPATPTGIFDDVPPGNPFAWWIEELFARGITGGCSTNPPLYCPANPVTRGQMAVFLTTTWGLPMN